MNEIKSYGDGIKYAHSNDIVADAKLIIDSAQRAAHQAVNVALVQRNWLLGMRITEENLGNQSRSELYGKKVVPLLAEELTKAYGKGFTRTSLYQYVRFYRYFPEIVQTASGQSLPRLSWSHYVELLRVSDPKTRKWYEDEAFEQGWTVSMLSRNISTQYYQRLLANHIDKLPAPERAHAEETERTERLAFIKNPMVVEFLGLPSNPELHESKLETAIIANLQQFLLELGKGYAFVARQEHIRTEWSDFYSAMVGHGVDIMTLVNYVQTTQPKTWKIFEGRCKTADPSRMFFKAFQDAVNANGILRVLKHGFKHRGLRFKVVEFKPESHLNPKTEGLYKKNCLRCIRQFHYSATVLRETPRAAAIWDCVMPAFPRMSSTSTLLSDFCLYCLVYCLYCPMALALVGGSPTLGSRGTDAPWARPRPRPRTSCHPRRRGAYRHERWRRLPRS